MIQHDYELASGLRQMPATTVPLPQPLLSFAPGLLNGSEASVAKHQAPTAFHLKIPRPPLPRRRFGTGRRDRRPNEFRAAGPGELAENRPAKPPEPERAPASGAGLYRVREPMREPDRSHLFRQVEGVRPMSCWWNAFPSFPAKCPRNACAKRGATLRSGRRSPHFRQKLSPLLERHASSKIAGHSWLTVITQPYYPQ